MILFAANAVLWWAWGPARDWATNSEYYIVMNRASFLLGLPIFNAVIMGDPVIRDFRLGIDPLIFSKPVNRAQYLLGKFFGNFFVLVCCQAAFPLTLLVLQAFRPSQMIVSRTGASPGRSSKLPAMAEPLPLPRSFFGLHPAVPRVSLTQKKAPPRNS